MRANNLILALDSIHCRLVQISLSGRAQTIPTLKLLIIFKDARKNADNNLVVGGHCRFAALIPARLRRTLSQTHGGCSGYQRIHYLLGIAAALSFITVAF
jgi:hypothetical protein